MQHPVQITWRNVPPDEAAAATLQDQCEALDQRCGERITSCRVMVEMPHRQHRRGNHYHVRLDITVPGDAVVVRRDPPAHQGSEALHVAIRDAFAAANRQLRDYAARLPPHAG